MRRSFPAFRWSYSVAITLSVFSIAGVSQPLHSQTIPVIDLPAAKARTPVALGAVLGINETGNTVLVNDPVRRQLFAYDTTLTKSRIVFDSIGGTPNSYGSYQLTLNQYLGDSTVVPDIDARTLLVLDAQGKISRTFALPSVNDVTTFDG